nr:MFS transporter [Paenactinomyces guangxiensis]
MNEMNPSIPFHRKISYSLTDTAGNLLYCIISSYLLYFYTDVFGLSIGVAGTLLFVTRFIDAIDAPIWGDFNRPYKVEVRPK